jgi:hypothetical protein
MHHPDRGWSARAARVQRRVSAAWRASHDGVTGMSLASPVVPLVVANRSVEAEQGHRMAVPSYLPGDRPV